MRAGCRGIHAATLLINILDNYVPVVDVKAGFLCHPVDVRLVHLHEEPLQVCPGETGCKQTSV